MNHSLIDTHCHLYAAPLCLDKGLVIQRAKASGVTGIVVPGTQEQDSREAVALAQEYRGFVFAAIGIHPQVVEENDLIWLYELAKSPYVIAIGEIGLDSEVKEPSMEVQESRFIQQMAIAKEHDLPVLVHCRGALGKTVSLLEDWGGKGGILHAWPGNKEATRTLLEKGFYCGACGVITRPSSTKKRENIYSIPLEKIVLETDSPYIGTQKSPKGQVEPSDLMEICEALSVLHGVPREKIAQITTENALKIIKKMGL